MQSDLLHISIYCSGIFDFEAPEVTWGCRNGIQRQCCVVKISSWTNLVKLQPFVTQQLFPCRSFCTRKLYPRAMLKPLSLLLNSVMKHFSISFQAENTTLTSTMTATSLTWTRPTTTSQWCTMHRFPLTKMTASPRSQQRSQHLMTSLGSVWISATLTWKDLIACTTAVSHDSDIAAYLYLSLMSKNTTTLLRYSWNSIAEGLWCWHPECSFPPYPSLWLCWLLPWKSWIRQ